MSWWRFPGWLVGLATLPAAVALTAVRLLDPGSGWGVRLESFTPLAIPAYVVGLVVLAVWTLRRGDGSRAVLATPLVLALFGLGLHLWWFSPLLLGTPPAAAAGAEPLRVLNSNLFEGRGDAGQVVRDAGRAGVDVLVVEEVTGEDLVQMSEAGIEDLMPYRIGRPDGTVNGTMVFANRPLGAATQVDTVHQSWLVTVGQGDQAVRLLAVHPVAPVTVGEWHDDLDLILSTARSARPDLIVGDFNTTPDHPELRELDAAGWSDAAQLSNAGWQPTWPANGLGPLSLLPRLVQIDHVLVGPRLTALSTRTLDVPGTDHQALLAEVAQR